MFMEVSAFYDQSLYTILLLDLSSLFAPHPPLNVMLNQFDLVTATQLSLAFSQACLSR